MDDYESEKALSFTECQTRCTNQQLYTNNNQRRKVSSLVTKLNSRSMCGKLNESLLTKHKVEESDGKENNINMDCHRRSSETLTHTRRSHTSQKRLYCNSSSSSNCEADEPSPKK